MNAVDVNSGDEMRDLYRELILDHARSPRHFGKLEDVTHSAEGINPLCGDKLRLYLQVGADNKIGDAGFEGSGCAISVASASLLTDTVIGLSVPEALDYFDAVTARMTQAHDQRHPAVEFGKIVALDGVRDFPSRIKCATLAWHALNSALSNQTSTVTTE